MSTQDSSGQENLAPENSELEVITPDWPAPANVHAYSTTRLHGMSEGVFSGLNLALHVGDEPEVVEQNRQHLRSSLKLPADPYWLNQVHQASAVNIAEQTSGITPDADASFSLDNNQVCVVMTADCLPVLICNRAGNKVAAAHAGWRGLAEGILESTISALDETADQLLVWLGPAIGPDSFEVGDDVRQAFFTKFEKMNLPEQYASDVASAFVENKPGHYLADIYQLARLTLKSIGIEAVYGGEHCTFDDANHFYSFRRDGKTGRQASLIWFCD